jgi:cytoskeletal protein CcmA (bactofilin family)
MFGSKNTATNSVEQVETIIGKETQIIGTILAKGTIRIDGKLEGDLQTTGDVIVGQSGEVKAQMKARSATIAGTVTGNVSVDDKLELFATAKLFGDIKVDSLIIGEGAIFKGACEMQHPATTSGGSSMATNKKDK